MHINKRCSVSHENAISLLNQLSDSILSNKKISLVCDKKLHNLQKDINTKLLHILYSSEDVLEQRELSLYEEYIWLCFKFDEQRKYDKAQQLRKLINQLKYSGAFDPHSANYSVLKVLISLSSLSQEKTISILKPKIIDSVSSSEPLPNIPLNYGDSNLQSAATYWYYPNFPAYLFDDRNLIHEESASNYFTMEYGKLKKNQYSSNQSDMPKLNFFEINTDNSDSATLKSQEPCVDEGYASSQCSGTSYCLDDYFGTYEDQPKESFHKFYFITESSNESVSMINKLHYYNMKYLYGAPLPVWIEERSNELGKDMLYVMNGIESNCFIWDEEMKTFKVADAFHYYNITRNNFVAIAEELISCGNCVKTLENIFSEVNMIENTGRVWKACINVFKKFLFLYRSKLMTFEYECFTLKLIEKFKNLSIDINFLTSITMSLKQYLELDANGFRMISFLCDQLVSTEKQRHSYYILSLLNAGMSPLFKYIEKWIYCGDNIDHYSEFFIISNKYNIEMKCDKYWSNAYELVKEDFASQMLRNIIKLAFNCGKTVNFLSSFANKNGLITEGKCDHPKIAFALNEENLGRSKISCLQFSSKVLSALSYEESLSIHEYDKNLKEKLSNINEITTLQHNKILENIKKRKVAIKENEIKQKKLQMQEILKNIEEAKRYKLEQELIEELKDQKLIESQKIIKELKDAIHDKSLQKELSSFSNKMKHLQEKEEVLIKKLNELNDNYIKDTILYYPHVSNEILNNYVIQLSGDETDNTLNKIGLKEPLLITQKNIFTNKDDIKNLNIISEEKITVENDFAKPSDQNENFDLSSFPVQSNNNNNSINGNINYQSNKYKNQGNLNINCSNKLAVLKMNKEVGRLEKETSKEHERITPNSVQYEILEKDILLKGSSQKKRKNKLKNNVYSKLPWFKENSSKGNERTHFVDMDLKAAVNLTSTTSVLSYNIIEKESYDYSPKLNEISGHLENNKLSLSLHYMMKTILIHVKSQLQLASTITVNNLLITQGLLHDFESLQKIMLGKNMSFYRSIASAVSQKLNQFLSPKILCTPGEMNYMLNEGLCNSQMNISGSLSFVVKNVPDIFISPMELWNCVHIQYKVAWPKSIIIDESSMSKYVKISSFMFNLHHVMYVTDDLFKIFVSQNLKKRKNLNKKLHHLCIHSFQIRQFVRVIFTYVSQEAIQISIEEFNKNIRNNLTIDDLYNVHSKFLDKIIIKCFLDSKGALVCELLEDIFSRVHKFYNLVYQIDPDSIQNEIYNLAKKTYNEFQKISHYLTKLLQKVSAYTRIEHVEAFDLLLNFNSC